MKKITLFILLLSLFSVSPVFGQFDILKKAKDKIKEATKPKDGSDSDQKNGSATDARKKSSVNSGAEMVLAKEDYKSFDEAKPHSVNRVVDGDPLWLYVKFKGTLADYVHRSEYPDEDGSIKYILVTDMGREGEDGDFGGSERLVFKKDELNVTELKLNLSPGKSGRNKTLPFFLEFLKTRSPRVWSNEIRLSKNPDGQLNRSDYFAIVPITYDVADGVAKYRKMNEDFKEARFKGVREENTLPDPTDFNDAALKSKITAKLKAAGVTPVKFYFTKEDWEVHTLTPTVERVGEKFSLMYAAYTYQKGKECLYGVANVRRDYSYALASFVEPSITLIKDFPIGCEKLK